MQYVNEEFKKAIGERLKALRLKNNLTLDGLVEKLNGYYVDIDEKSVRRYEKGEFLPKIDNLIALAEIFDTSLDYIVYGKETSDDNSYTWYDNFKRLNRLIYSLSVNFCKDETTGKYYLEFWTDEGKVYWDRITCFASSNNYYFENKQKDPAFSVKELDALMSDFIEDKEQLVPTMKRMEKFLISQSVDPEACLKEKLRKTRDKKV